MASDNGANLDSLVSFKLEELNKLPKIPLPPRYTSSYIPIPTRNLISHVIEWGDPWKPLLLLVHGFPELAISWKAIMPQIAGNEYYVVACDLRGFGRTVAIEERDDDLNDYILTSYAQDILELVTHLRASQNLPPHVKCIIGHGIGSKIAGTCVSSWPEVFRSQVLLSELWGGPPERFSESEGSAETRSDDPRAVLEQLSPPRLLYPDYNASDIARTHWNHPERGIRAMLEQFFHRRSGLGRLNYIVTPRPFNECTPQELDDFPRDILIPRTSSIEAAVGEYIPTIRRELDHWFLSREFLLQEYERTGFGAALNFYRAQSDPDARMELFVQLARSIARGGKIHVPTLIIIGERDFCNQIIPATSTQLGDLYSNFEGPYIIPGAGEWPHMENRQETVRLILEFLRGRASETI